MQMWATYPAAKQAMWESLLRVWFQHGTTRSVYFGRQWSLHLDTLIRDSCAARRLATPSQAAQCGSFKSDIRSVLPMLKRSWRSACWRASSLRTEWNRDAFVSFRFVLNALFQESCLEPWMFTATFGTPPVITIHQTLCVRFYFRFVLSCAVNFKDFGKPCTLRTKQ